MTDRPVSVLIMGFLVEHFPSARHRAIGEDDPLLANGILDSLGILDLVGYLEAEFGITVSDEDLVPEHFETRRRLEEFVTSKRAGHA
jgi:acyl carrier protein